MADNAPSNATAAMDFSPYKEVVIVKTGEVDGHDYKRGTTHMVDAATLKALKAASLVA